MGGFVSVPATTSHSLAISSTHHSTTSPVASTSLSSVHVTSHKSTCPSVKTSTVTSYNSTVFSAVSTFTSTIPVYPNVDYEYYSSLSTVYESPINTTVTSTSYTNTTIIVVPARTTVTAPTPSGFTPVLCEASWLDPTISNTGTLTSKYTETAYTESTVLATSTSYGTLITSVTTSTISTLVTITSTVSATTPSTSTRNNPTKTIYEACGTNNVVKLVPDGQTIYNVDLLPEIDQVLVTAIDEYDCCALCQANSTCIGSIYLAKYPFGNLGTTRCDLLFRKDKVCNPHYTGGANVTAKAADNPYAVTFISNSGCGQIIYNVNLYQEVIR